METAQKTKDDAYELIYEEGNQVLFERQKYLKELQGMKATLGLLQEDSVSEFDKFNLEELKMLIEKRQLLNKREERYYDELLDFQVLYKERRESKYDIIPIAQGPATKLDLKSKYLLEERDSILKERLKILEKYEKVKKFTGYSSHGDRPNLLRNSGINVLDNSSFTLQIKDPRELKQENANERKGRALETFDIVDDIERVRVKAHQMGRINNGFVHSLGIVLEELQGDYMGERAKKKNQDLEKTAATQAMVSALGIRDDTDSIDQLQSSQNFSKAKKEKNKKGKKRNKGDPDEDEQERIFEEHEQKQFVPEVFPRSILLTCQKKDRIRRHLMTMEKALDFDSKIQDMTSERAKMISEIKEMKETLESQEQMIREYEQLLFEKKLFRKEIDSEIELLRAEKFAARDQLLRVRLKRQDVDAAKRKNFLDERARFLTKSKDEFNNMMENYMNYRETTYVRRQPDISNDKLIAYMESINNPQMLQNTEVQNSHDPYKSATRSKYDTVRENEIGIQGSQTHLGSSPQLRIASNSRTKTLNANSGSMGRQIG